MYENKKTSGFTLIELLVVIAIIALLSSVVMSSVASTRIKSRNATRTATLKTMRTALEMYFNDNNRYPTTGGAWWGESVNGLSKTTSGANAYIPGLTPSYISVLPTDALKIKTGWSGYLYRSNGTDYKLLCHSTCPEGTWNSSFPFYDPIRPGNAWQISSSQTARNGW
jgi:type II secretion system protein G